MANSSAVPKPLRTLLVEDDPDDADLVLMALRQSGYEPISRRVQRAADLRDALLTATWDLIVSDYSMPGFNGGEALTVVLELRPQIPFILISGNLEEDVAASIVRAGARAVLRKGQIPQLIAAIERALEETTPRSERGRVTPG